MSYLQPPASLADQTIARIVQIIDDPNGGREPFVTEMNHLLITIDVNAQVDYYGWPIPLMSYYLKQSVHPALSTIVVFIDRGVNLSEILLMETTGGGRTLLHWAVNCWDANNGDLIVRMAKMFFDRGADFRIKDSRGETPFDAAMKVFLFAKNFDHSFRLVTLFLNKGLTIDVPKLERAFSLNARDIGYKVLNQQAVHWILTNSSEELLDDIKKNIPDFYLSLPWNIEYQMANVFGNMQLG